ncbi:MAG: DUF3124 domain-containing protein [Pseudomonadota bacterium]
MKLLIGLFLALTVMGEPYSDFGHRVEAAEPVAGGTVYVPVYSHIYVGPKGTSFDLAISLSIRNTDPIRPITILSVDYYDTAGKPVRRFQEKPLDLGPWASTDYFVSESDSTGGFGASFIVKWKGPDGVNEPLMDGVMAGTRLGQGISFTSRGTAIRDPRP